MHINRRAKIGLIVGATVLVAVVVAVLGISAVITRHDNDPVSVLPFTDLKGPNGVAVGSTGEVYVADELGGQVRKLAPGSTTQVAIPFDIPSPENPNGVGLDPVAIAVGPAGDIYVVDGHNDRVLKLAAGSTTPTVLPLADLADPNGVAVDGSGNVYIAESHVRTPRVLKLPADATAPTVLPLTDVKFPKGVAVDGAGNVYVSDSGNNRILKLANGSGAQSVLPFTGLNSPRGIAANKAGDVYVADRGNSRVLKLAAGATSQEVVLSAGQYDPAGVAVDTAGNIYIADLHNHQVLKLAAHS
ncbi:Serine/threonine-protein kinase [Mycobacterium lentiflavum]|nr:Serine/threonine-protein kinase [Mycobacterium lentiflavum]